jgi:hypothetical protein
MLHDYYVLRGYEDETRHLTCWFIMFQLFRGVSCWFIVHLLRKGRPTNLWVKSDDCLWLLSPLKHANFTLSHSQEDPKYRLPKSHCKQSYPPIHCLPTQLYAGIQLFRTWWWYGLHSEIHQWLTGRLLGADFPDFPDPRVPIESLCRDAEVSVTTCFETVLMITVRSKLFFVIKTEFIWCGKNGSHFAAVRAIRRETLAFGF